MSAKILFLSLLSFLSFAANAGQLAVCWDRVNPQKELLFIERHPSEFSDYVLLSGDGERISRSETFRCIPWAIDALMRSRMSEKEKIWHRFKYFIGCANSLYHVPGLAEAYRENNPAELISLLRQSLQSGARKPAGFPSSWLVAPICYP